MNDVLELYERPGDPAEPVVGVDEKGKQLLQDARSPLPLASHQGIREDYHYRRNGTRNLFVGVDPKGGWRYVVVTKRKTKQDFANYLADLVAWYPDARKVHVILDNYKTHSLKNLQEILGADHPLFTKLVLHYTPVHGSWLNVAEIEISILERQCLGRRIPEEGMLITEVAAWEATRNAHGTMITWNFTREKARKVFKLKSEPN